VVMEWMATITGDHVGYPGLWDLGGGGEKSWGEKIARLSMSNFRGRVTSNCFAFYLKILFFTTLVAKI